MESDFKLAYSIIFLLNKEKILFKISLNKKSLSLNFVKINDNRMAKLFQ